MAKADRLKEEIGWLKVLSGFCAALDASVIAWLVQNYETVSVTRSVGAIVSILVFTALVVYAVAALYRCFKILEAL